MHPQLLSHVQLFATPQTIALQDPLSIGFSKQETWNGLPFPSPGDLSNLGIEPTSPALAGRFFTTSTIWEAQRSIIYLNFFSTFTNIHPAIFAKSKLFLIRFFSWFKKKTTGKSLSSWKCKGSELSNIIDNLEYQLYSMTYYSHL